MNHTVRRIRADEATQLRDLRLHALADAPMAFSSSLAREQAYRDDLWQARAAAASHGCAQATFIAEYGGRWVGMVSGRHVMEADAAPHWLPRTG
jgi:hypothetical protein